MLGHSDLMAGMIPAYFRKFVVVAGYAVNLVLRFLRMVLGKVRLFHNTVAGAAGADYGRAFAAFMVAAFTGDIVALGMGLMLKNNPSAQVFQKYPLRGRRERQKGFGFRPQKTCQGHKKQHAAYSGNMEVTLRQNKPTLKRG